MSHGALAGLLAENGVDVLICGGLAAARGRLRVRRRAGACRRCGRRVPRGLHAADRRGKLRPPRPRRGRLRPRRLRALEPTALTHAWARRTPTLGKSVRNPKPMSFSPGALFSPAALFLPASDRSLPSHKTERAAASLHLRLWTNTLATSMPLNYMYSPKKNSDGVRMRMPSTSRSYVPCRTITAFSWLSRIERRGSSSRLRVPSAKSSSVTCR